MRVCEIDQERITHLCHNHQQDFFDKGSNSLSFILMAPASRHTALKVILHTDKKGERKAFSQVIINSLFPQTPCLRSGWHNLRCNASCQVVLCCPGEDLLPCQADKHNWLRFFRHKRSPESTKMSHQILINNGWRKELAFHETDELAEIWGDLCWSVCV